VVTAEPTTDQLLWNETLQEMLGIKLTNMSSESRTLYTFSANISDEFYWEKFLMSFSFIQSEVCVSNRTVGNRTINITAHDGSNNVTVTATINVLPLPPVIQIIVQDTTFREGQNFILLRDDFPIAVIQDKDALFVSLDITLQ